MTTMEREKEAAGRYAAGLVEDGMVLGLGTGSTVRYLLESIGERIRQGSLRGIVGIPTSEATRVKAEALGIPLGGLMEYPVIDLALDGADEVDSGLDLIKGLGGALLREKIVVAASKRFIVMVDSSKRVARLGTKSPLPVEVDPFSVGIQIPYLRLHRARPELRLAETGPFRTDGGNFILDCHFDGGIEDPLSLAAALDSRPGIVEHGLFLGLAEGGIVADETGVEMLRRGSPDDGATVSFAEDREGEGR